MANTEQQIQSLASQVQQLTAQLTSQQQELNNTRTALEQQAQATNAALTVAQSAVSQLTATTQSKTSAEPKRRPLNPKLAKAPESFTGSDSDWERFKTWIGTVDSEYPDLLKFAAVQTDEINPAEMIPVAKVLCTDLGQLPPAQCAARTHSPFRCGPRCRRCNLPGLSRASR